ncbi:MAG: toxin TcdB middle/C-terminal domain-containing protein [Caldilineaceae bacterium]
MSPPLNSQKSCPSSSFRRRITIVRYSVQPQANNRHAVFLVAEKRDNHLSLRSLIYTAVPDSDPRIAHTLNLKFDEYANILQTVAVVYARQGNPGDDRRLTQTALISRCKAKSHLTYGENHFTKDFWRSTC